MTNSPNTSSFVGAAPEEMLADLKAVGRKAVPPDVARVRALRDEGQDFDRAQWQRLVDLGWIGLSAPVHLGGEGAGMDVVATVAEVLGRAAAPEPFASAAVLPLHWLAQLPGAAEQVVEDIVRGELIAGPAWQDEAGSIAVASPSVRANGGADAPVLNGTAWWLPVPDADVFMVLAQLSGEPVLVRCARDQRGLTLVPLELADGSRSAHLRFVDAPIEPAAVLARGDRVLRTLNAAVDATRLAVSAELLGVMERALEITLDHLRQRVQFGRPLGSFQALQHAAVDLFIQMRLTRAALEGATRVWTDPGSTDRDRAAASSSVKARASAASALITTKAVHLHGAIGFTDEHDLGQYVNRAVVLGAYLGTAHEHRDRYQELTDDEGLNKVGVAQ
ncbi:MAG: acyl-CoA dehydrogenase protein [Frankiales bacterium]|nr:acyl-CoA dehydrogenase protein [Frankiales bacterium]